MIYCPLWSNCMQWRLRSGSATSSSPRSAPLDSIRCSWTMSEMSSPTRTDLPSTRNPRWGSTVSKFYRKYWMKTAYFRWELGNKCSRIFLARNSDLENYTRKQSKNASFTLLRYTSALISVSLYAGSSPSITLPGLPVEISSLLVSVDLNIFRSLLFSVSVPHSLLSPFLLLAN